MIDHTLMAEQILIILGRWVVPVQTDQQHRRPNLSFRGEDLVISHGAVAVRNGIIVDVGKSENVVLKYSSDTVEIVDLSERHIIIPGQQLGRTRIRWVIPAVKINIFFQNKVTT